jgi:hypothetical protein
MCLFNLVRRNQCDILKNIPDRGLCLLTVGSS